MLEFATGQKGKWGEDDGDGSGEVNKMISFTVSAGGKLKGALYQYNFLVARVPQTR